jgi:hypothetical protein
MDVKINRHLKHLTLFDNQRRAWLVLSAFVSAIVLKIVYDWNKIEEHHLVWICVSLGLTVSIIWWYWTMRIIKELIQQRKEESEILYDIIVHIRDVQNEVKKLAETRVDKDK